MLISRFFVKTMFLQSVLVFFFITGNEISRRKQGTLFVDHERFVKFLKMTVRLTGTSKQTLFIVTSLCERTCSKCRLYWPVRPGPSCIRTVHRYLPFCRIFNGIFICLFYAVFSFKLWKDSCFSSFILKNERWNKNVELKDSQRIFLFLVPYLPECSYPLFDSILPTNTNTERTLGRG